MSMIGEPEHPGKSRILNRFVVSVACVFLFLVLIIAVPMGFYLSSNSSVRDKCHEDLTVPLWNVTFYPNGSAVDEEYVYPPGYHFSVNGTTRGCLCALEPCIRKCCARGEHLEKVPGKTSECKKNPESSPFDNLTLTVHSSSGVREVVAHDHFRILYGVVCRHGMFKLNPQTFPGDKHDLFADGRIRYVHGSHLDASEYCMDSMNGSRGINTFVCFSSPDDDTETKVVYTLYPVGMMISIVFLTATIVVYAILPTLRNLHGKTVLCHSTSLLVSYVGLTAIQLETMSESNFRCVFTAFTIQFSFLASLFWLNIMSFDIWWFFSGLRPPRGSVKERDHKKFIFYSLYAWGVPLTIVGISLVIDLVPYTPDTFVKPGFGVINCWFKDSKGAMLYFYLPAGIILLMNFLMFVTTSFKLQSYAKHKSYKNRFHLYLKLFIVMGVTWVMELISFFVGGPNYLWFVPDICNTLQGVFIFFIFVCKHKILRMLNEKLCSRWNLRNGISENSKNISASSSDSEMENVDVVAFQTFPNSCKSESGE